MAMNENKLTVEVVGVAGKGYTARITGITGGGSNPTRYLQSFGVKTEATDETGWGALAKLAKQMSDAGCMD